VNPPQVFNRPLISAQPPVYSQEQLIKMVSQAGTQIVFFVDSMFPLEISTAFVYSLKYTCR
jgi:hypothetical protein